MHGLLGDAIAHQTEVTENSPVDFSRSVIFMLMVISTQTVTDTLHKFVLIIFYMLSYYKVK